MKFGFILSGNYKLVDVSRVGQPRFDLLIKMTNLHVNEVLVSKICLKETELNKEIRALLEKREELGEDMPTYKGRFTEEEIFETRLYQNIKIKLCKTGFDNNIIFLLNLLESVEKNGESHILFLANNFGELRKFIEVNT